MANDKIYPNYLMHYRTKGSRNGVSTTKGYTAVGQKAKGKYENGQYVYDYSNPNHGGRNNLAYDPVARRRLKEGYTFSSYAQKLGEQNPWQQQGNDARAMTEYGNRMTAARKAKNKNGGYIDDEYAKNLAYNSQKNVFLKNGQPYAASKGARNNWQQQGNKYRAANEAWGRLGSGKSKGITGTDQKGNYGGFGTHASIEGSTRAINAASGLDKLRREKKNLSLYGSGDTKTRNSRSDIGNAFADAKADAKNAFKTMKQKALLNIVNKWSTGVRKDKKKKKSLKDLFK